MAATDTALIVKIRTMCIGLFPKRSPIYAKKKTKYLRKVSHLLKKSLAIQLV